MPLCGMKKIETREQKPFMLTLSIIMLTLSMTFLCHMSYPVSLYYLMLCYATVQGPE